MLKLIFQYFGHLMWRTGSLEKTLILGKIKGRRRGWLRMRYGLMASLTQWTWVWASSGSWCWTGKPGLLQCMESKRVRQDWAPELKLQLHDKDWNVCVCQWLSCVQLFATPWTVARHAPLSMEFLRQEYWSGLPFPPPQDLPDSGIKSRFPEFQANSLPLHHLGNQWINRSRQ